MRSPCGCTSARTLADDQHFAERHGVRDTRGLFLESGIFIHGAPTPSFLIMHKSEGGDRFEKRQRRAHFAIELTSLHHRQTSDRRDTQQQPPSEPSGVTASASSAWRTRSAYTEKGQRGDTTSSREQIEPACVRVRTTRKKRAPKKSRGKELAFSSVVYPFRERRDTKGTTTNKAMMTAAGAPALPRRTRRARVSSSTASSAVAASSAALALGCLVLFSAPAPADSFFRPTTRVKRPPGGPNPVSSLPRNRHATIDTGAAGRSARTTTQMAPLQERNAGRCSGSGMPPLLMSGSEGEGGETEVEEGEGDRVDEEEEMEDGDDEAVQVPTIEVPEMMSEEVSFFSCVDVCVSLSALFVG